jgi:hypothetical protein
LAEAVCLAENQFGRRTWPALRRLFVSFFIAAFSEHEATDLSEAFQLFGCAMLWIDISAKLHQHSNQIKEFSGAGFAESFMAIAVSLLTF